MPQFLNILNTGLLNYTYDQAVNSYIFDILCDSSKQCQPYITYINPGSYRFELWGARGGGDKGGNGAYVSGYIEIKKKLNLYLFVGTRSGYNGGGTTNKADFNGGGASDIRLSDTSSSYSLQSRIIVAGGGGSSVVFQGVYGIGGCGGGQNGGDATVVENPSHPEYEQVYASTGGTQTSGGKTSTLNPNAKDGEFGYGGDGCHTNYCTGGGGGYYGGGGGSDGTYCGSGGGGGSSFVSGNAECNAVNKNGEHTNTPYHYSGLFFTNSVMTSCSSEGDGKIKITQISSYIYFSCANRRKFNSFILLRNI